MRFARKKTIELKKEDDTKKGVDTGDESQALCDECWNWIVMPRLEQDDRLKSTMTKRTVATCVWCEDYAARWSCSECAFKNEIIENVVYCVTIIVVIIVKVKK